ncbi:MAG: hypothetical protein JXN59_08520, partial [Anaerolineae bacterium]|nr:hypothetical protein [Anaerolineae bacterium]
MLIEECYRAALVALRDGQWEEAATHLLTIAIDNPTYRDVDRVLEVLQRTRSVSYWCAAFTIAQEQAAYEPARAALEQIVALAPALPRLESLRQALAAIAPPEAQAASPLEDAGEDQGIAPVSPPAPAAEPDDPPAAVYTSAAGDSEP